jgi:hypothetical protein
VRLSGIVVTAPGAVHAMGQDFLYKEMSLKDLQRSH